jgi:hypothetical protein
MAKEDGFLSLYTGLTPEVSYCTPMQRTRAHASSEA